MWKGLTNNIKFKDMHKLFHKSLLIIMAIILIMQLFAECSFTCATDTFKYMKSPVVEATWRTITITTTVVTHNLDGTSRRFLGWTMMNELDSLLTDFKYSQLPSDAAAFLSNDSSTRWGGAAESMSISGTQEVWFLPTTTHKKSEEMNRFEWHEYHLIGKPRFQ